MLPILEDLLCGCENLQAVLLRLGIHELSEAGLLDYLRAGVFICGGGVRIPGIHKLAEKSFQLSASVGKTNSISGLKSTLDQPEFATAIGLVKFGSFEQRKKIKKSSLLNDLMKSLRF